MSGSDLERGLTGRLARNLTLQAGTQAVSIVLGLITTAVLARRLGPESFGGFTYLFSFIVMFQTLNELGTGLTLVREVAQAPHRMVELVQNVLGLRLVLAFASVALGYIALAVMPYVPHVEPLSPAYKLSLRVFLWILPIQAFSLPAVVLQARLQLGRGQIIDLANRLTGFTLMMLSVWSGHGLLFVTLSLVCGELAGAIVVIALTRHALPPIPRFNVAVWKHVLRLSLPLSGNNLLLQILNRVDQLMLQALRDLNQLAYYGLALKLPSLFERVPQLANATMFPVMSQLAVTDPQGLRRVYRKMLTTMALAIVPMTAAVMWLAPYIVPVWFGPGYDAVVPLMRVVILATALLYLAFWGGNLLIVLHRVHDSLGAMAAATAINLVLNVFWIPRYGALGAAWATVVGYGVLCVLTMLLAEAALRRVLRERSS